MEITKALSALQPLYGKGNVEIVTNNGHRVRGIVRSMKTTQALSTPTLKVERADGEVIKIPFTAIVEIINQIVRLSPGGHPGSFGPSVLHCSLNYDVTGICR